MARDADDVDDGGWWKSSCGGDIVLLARSLPKKLGVDTEERDPSFF
jgi:hypothetical protein